MVKAMTSRMPAELAEVLTSLGIDAARSSLTRVHEPGSVGFLVLPALDRPQLIVPIHPAGASMIRERRARGRLAQSRNIVVAMLIESGLASRLPLMKLTLGDEALGRFLAGVIGCVEEDLPSVAGELTAGIMVGPPRANRKPVLRVITEDGRTWGYVKVGINELTRGLVRQEAQALNQVNAWQLLQLRAPQVLCAGTLDGREFLATSPLQNATAGAQPTSLPVGPTRELFSTAEQRDVPLRHSQAMRPPLDVPNRAAAQIESLAQRLLALVGDERIPLGASHGDWTPWNMSWSNSHQGERVLEVWDWERSATGVPQGHDVVHFEASRVRADRQDGAEHEFVSGLAASLASCGIAPALTSRLLATYLVTVGRRYAADLSRVSIEPLARRLDWVTALLAQEVSRMESESTWLDERTHGAS